MIFISIHLWKCFRRVRKNVFQSGVTFITVSFQGAACLGDDLEWLGRLKNYGAFIWISNCPRSTFFEFLAARNSLKSKFDLCQWAIWNFHAKVGPEEAAAHFRNFRDGHGFHQGCFRFDASALSRASTGLLTQLPAQRRTLHLALTARDSLVTGYGSMNRSCERTLAASCGAVKKSRTQQVRQLSFWTKCLAIEVFSSAAMATSCGNSDVRKS